MTTTPLCRLRILLWLLTVAHDALAQNLSLPRWGQASAVVNNVLFIHGGKTDANGESYTSSYTNNDLFSLQLDRPFDISSPPWQYLGGSLNSSANQGPTLAWHTLSAFNYTDLLVFGGDGGPNSPIVLPSQPDSALLLQIDNPEDPSWFTPSASWASEPIRRIYHAASSSQGKIWLIGGEKDDGSGLAFSDHYVFDPTIPIFTQLSSVNAPPAIYGHQTVVLANGTMLVMGGVSQAGSQLIPFTTIWSLDTTQSNLEWSTIPVSTAAVPPPRRAFAAVLLFNNSILIHGGSDAGFTTSFSDGWLLDTSTSPMTWTNVTNLAQLGARRDHFAVAMGNQILFGFGYGTDAGASPTLQCFDVDSSTFTSSYTVPSVITPPHTLPSPSNWPTSTNGNGNNGNGSPTQTGSDPGQTGSGGSNPHTGSNSGSNQPTTTLNPGDPGEPASADHMSTSNLAITLGTIFGVSALAAGVIVVYLYRRRRAGDDAFRRERFVLITGDDLEGHPPEFGAYGTKPSGADRLKKLAAGAVAGLTLHNIGRRNDATGPAAVGGRRARFDMLADEDDQDYEVIAFSRNIRRDGSGSSRSWYSGHGQEGSANARPAFSHVIDGSLNSLRSVGAMIGIGGRSHSRVGTQGSVDGVHPPEWWEKTHTQMTSDPFTDQDDDDIALLGDKNKQSMEALPLGAMSPAIVGAAVASRPRGGRNEDNVSAYTDPFEERSVHPDSDGDEYTGRPSNAEAGPSRSPRVYASSTLSSSKSSAALAGLPPLTTVISNATSSDQTTSHASSSQFDHSSPALSGTLRDGSHSSHDPTMLSHSSSTRPRSTSIIGAVGAPSRPVRRSDSWWARFRRTSLRDRNSFTDNPKSPTFEFRDPNPAPKLLPIHESSLSQSNSPNSPDDPNAVLRRASTRRRGQKDGVYDAEGHRRSLSSLQTMKTADSEAIEKMARKMDVAQRIGSMSSHETYPSSSGGSIEEDAYHGLAQPQLSDVASSDNGSRSTIMNDTVQVASPIEYDDGAFGQIRLIPPQATPQSSSSSGSVLPAPRPVAIRRPTGGAVAARVAEYERRMSQDVSPVSPTPVIEPVKKRHKTGHSVNYGLIEKPDLFVANPDRHAAERSSNS